jgi:DNA polymerase III alpha subunit
MSEIIPIFYDDSSQRGINVWWSEKDCNPDGPQSIISMAKKAGLKQIYFVSTKFYSFVTAWRLCEENNLQLIFGLEIWICNNPEDHSESSIADESKVIVWMRNSDAYKDLIKLYSKIYTNINNKYYHFRGSWTILKEMWTKNLLLTIPFFDSFLHRNTLNYGSSIVPDFPSKPILFEEVNSGLPFDSLVKESLDNFAKDGYEILKTKTIYYPDYGDIKAYTVFRAIREKSSFHKPQLDHFGSSNFCFADYIKLTEVFK